VSQTTIDKPPFLIPQIAGFIAWIEALVTTVSSLLLSFVAVLTIASALNVNGALLQNNGMLAQAYAWCQGIGIEGQLSGLTFMAIRAARTHKGGQAFFLWTMAILLAVASFIAIELVNYQQTFGGDFAGALVHVGISNEAWVWIRAAVLVVLIMLAAAMRYQPPAAPVDVEQQIRAIEDRKRIAQAQAGARAQGLANMIGGTKTAVQTGLAAQAAPASPAPPSSTDAAVAAQEAEIQRLEAEVQSIEAAMGGPPSSNGHVPDFR